MSKLPSSEQAERAIIGTLVQEFASPDYLIECTGRINEAHFRADEKTLWMAIVKAEIDGRPYDSASLSVFLESGSNGRGEALSTLLNECVAKHASTKNLLPYYCDRLIEAKSRRDAAVIGKRIEAGELSPKEAIEALREIAPKPTAGELFVDLEKIIAGGLQPERPTVAEILPGKCLLYAGRLNEIHAEPSVGKTNIALSFAIYVMVNGGHVLFIDPEDTAIGTLNRLIGLGANIGHVVEGFHYLHNPTPEDFDRAILWAKKHKPTLAVLDGLAEAMTAEGKNEDVPMDVLPFLRQRLRPFAEQGASVLISDHVTKSLETRGRWARGSGAKLGRYDGAVYSAELVESYSPTVAGKVRLRVSKDRNGGIGVSGQVVAEINFTPQEGRTLVTFQEPAEAKPFKPTAIMAKICERLALFPDSSKRDLLRLGAHEWVEEAISHLVKDGFLSTARQGQRMKFMLLKTYSGTE